MEGQCSDVGDAVSDCVEHDAGRELPRAVAHGFLEELESVDIWKRVRPGTTRMQKPLERRDVKETSG
jgi:hypothetical protein